jgi:hypothetical protein
MVVVEQEEGEREDGREPVCHHSKRALRLALKGCFRR